LKPNTQKSIFNDDDQKIQQPPTVFATSNKSRGWVNCSYRH